MLSRTLRTDCKIPFHGPGINAINSEIPREIGSQFSERKTAIVENERIGLNEGKKVAPKSKIQTAKLKTIAKK